MRSAKLRESLTKLISCGVKVSTVLDVGVQHSTPVLLDLFQKQHHVLFEPVEEYYKHIRNNYSSLSYTLVEGAVSDQNGLLQLHTEKKTRGSEISHSYLTKSPTLSSRSIQVVTLDSYLLGKDFESPFLLKIDVEGPNVPGSIIQGSLITLKSTAVVIIEMTVDKLVERASLLHHAGFDVWDICDLCYYADCLWQADFIFINRSLKQVNDELSPMRVKPFRPECWQKGFEQ